MKRFYKVVTPFRGPQGYLIHLDGKPVKTPSGQEISVPSEKLAAHVVGEWAAQRDVIDPQTMPLTQILITALERGEQDRDAIRDQVLEYLNTDLLCYRTDMPEELSARQAATWNPWLEWFAAQSGVMLGTTFQLVALTQAPAAHDYVRGVIDQSARWDFTAIQMVTALSGSVVLALAFAAGRASPEDIFAASHVDELYRAGLYNEALHGRDPHQEKTQNAFLQDLRALRLFLDSL